MTRQEYIALVYAMNQPTVRGYIRAKEVAIEIADLAEKHGLAPWLLNKSACPHCGRYPAPTG